MTESTLSVGVTVELRAELARQRRTARAVAADLGRSKMWLYDRLAGRTEFSLDDLEAVCRVLDLPITVLIARAVGDR